MELDDAEEAEVVPATVAELVDAITARETGPDAQGRPTFITTSPKWWVHGRVFGGMVVAQALNAAMRTVPAPARGPFPARLLPAPHQPGVAQRPTWSTTVRDGRSFSTREVTSEVEGKETFRMTCSFHAARDR